jgi:HD-GYP domain-containing protein (c-di-GMP phosphodiesterase class II)
MQDTLINDWLERVEQQQPGQRGHAERVAIYALALGQKLGLSSDDLQSLRWGMLLHDIGKLGVPDAIIRHPGKLSAKEWGQVMQHPTYGDNFLGDQDDTALLRSAVRCHHERWDGDGYPHGLKGQDIPLFGRIAAICDAWDCMLSDRAYSPAFTVGEAVAELRRCMNTQFDPVLVTVFLSMSARLVDIPTYVEHYT